MDDYLSQLMDIFQNGNLGREILFYVIILTAGWVFGKILSKRSVKAATNEVPGLPILGSSVALGRHGAAFVAAARKKHGDSFFFNLPGGQQMEFWHDPLLINTFFSSPDELITFRCVHLQAFCDNILCTCCLCLHPCMQLSGTEAPLV